MGGAHILAVPFTSCATLGLSLSVYRVGMMIARKMSSHYRGEGIGLCFGTVVQALGTHLELLLQVQLENGTKALCLAELP